MIYYYYNESVPLFLLDVYAKSEKIDLDKSELAHLKMIVHAIHEKRKGGK